MGGVRFEAVSEMPRPYVNVVLQATEHTRFLKNSLTRRGDAPNKLLNLLEQLLHKIKAKRRREIGIFTCWRLWLESPARVKYLTTSEG